MESKHYEAKIEIKVIKSVHVRAFNKDEARRLAKRYIRKDIELYNGKIKEVRRVRWK